MQRAFLVDWLVEVQTDLQLHTETIFLAVLILDRCVRQAALKPAFLIISLFRLLSQIIVTPENLQLLGCAVLLLASKTEGERPPLACCKQVLWAPHYLHVSS